MAKEKTKLKNLTVKKVDFVDAGANQEADILLTKRLEPDGEPEGFVKGLLSYIKKYLPSHAGNVEEEIEDIEKSGAQSFDDKLSERNMDRIRDEMWNVCYALQSSFISILMDGDLDKEQKREAMVQSASEFSQAVSGFIPQWSRGTIANVEICKADMFAPKAEVLKSMRGVLDQMIEKAHDDETLEHPATPVELEKGGNEEMKIDKSKMSPEDKLKFEEMAKAYGWGEEGEGIEPAPASAPAPAPASQGGTEKPAAPVNESAPADTGVEKGLHPEVAAELEALRKMRELFEERELYDVAKKYEVIGKKADSLVPQLKVLKSSGDAAYKEYLAILDEMVSIQNNSGLFGEIGKSGGYVPANTSEEDEAFAKARAKAAEIRKSRPEITMEQAIDQAIMENPELHAALL